jgi:hypothetical protein
VLFPANTPAVHTSKTRLGSSVGLKPSPRGGARSFEPWLILNSSWLAGSFHSFFKASLPASIRADHCQAPNNACALRQRFEEPGYKGAPSMDTVSKHPAVRRAPLPTATSQPRISFPYIFTSRVVVIGDFIAPPLDGRPRGSPRTPGNATDQSRACVPQPQYRCVSCGSRHRHTFPCTTG